ncbi:Phosphonoacetate hydrolase [Corynespora cassiicola Philippines]|uniref:Phosphonoacetate hydrolase n=1 Tax=Corynespora cassiicola Philippines TaxID=1448308 RepID=A0A2T2NW10_CORCC|nr:Phosphonoacetate hydrolase [Corynespora cassiicola Philippines]
MTPKITLHNRTYNLPTTPVVVICVDGFDPTYLDHGIASGTTPNLASMVHNGFHTTAHSCMPSFTNPNNVSIITGVPPAIHGIAGNFFLDAETGEEKMVLDDSLLRGDTLLQLLSNAGIKVAAVTAKDKLRRILSHGLDPSNSISFSAEYAGAATLSENGIEGVEGWIGRKAPPQYSGDLSIFVLDAGVRLLEEKRAQVLYLTLSDYVQHKHAPGEPEADAFFKELDERVGKLMGLGATVAITGDHGMSNKCVGNEPNVLFLEDVLRKEFGEEAGIRVVCPITDPFVRHHGALGSFVRVHVKEKERVKEMIEIVKPLDQVEVVLDGESAAGRYDMPKDREGDIVVIAKKNAVVGSCEKEHDLSNIRDHNLRSHGGLSEQEVPLLLSKPVKEVQVAMKMGWRNYDIFDLALNW